MEICLRFKCKNKKCRKEVSMVETANVDIVEVSIDFELATMEYVCPHCNELNKINLGKVIESRLPMGGVRF